MTLNTRKLVGYTRLPDFLPRVLGDAIGVCDAIVKGMPNRPAIIGSDHAWYSPIADQVGMPARENFLGSEEYYSTFFP